MMTRREALKTTALVSAAAITLPSALAQPAAGGAQAVPYTLPALPYAFDALEPHIDARTMEVHHDRHHKAYVDNLNKAVAEFPDVAKKSPEELVRTLDTVPEKIRTAVRNNGGGHYNHSLFWQMMRKGSATTPEGAFAKAIEKSFGDVAAFKTKFAEAAMKNFGSGWTWLTTPGPGTGTLMIESTANQDSPLTMAPLSADMKSFLKDNEVATPTQSAKIILLGLDTWEHAYYLKYQNKRADYIAAWWNVVNWDFVAGRYAQLAK